MSKDGMNSVSWRRTYGFRLPPRAWAALSARPGKAVTRLDLTAEDPEYLAEESCGDHKWLPDVLAARTLS
jgi:hypothetical protein